MKKLIFTDLEEKVLKCLIDGLYAEPGFSDISPKDISKNTGIEMKVLRGVLASLVKKGIILIEENQGYDIVYLDERFYHLHPEWSKA